MWVNVLWSGVVWFAAVEINRDGTGRGDGSVSGPGWLGGATMGQMGQMVWILSRQGSWTLVTAFIVAMFVVVVVAMLMCMMDAVFWGARGAIFWILRSPSLL